MCQQGYLDKFIAQTKNNLKSNDFKQLLMQNGLLISEANSQTK